MIGDGEGGLLQLARAHDEIIDAVRAVEERVFGVAVKMDERHRALTYFLADRVAKREKVNSLDYSNLTGCSGLAKREHSTGRVVTYIQSASCGWGTLRGSPGSTMSVEHFR